MIQIKDSVFYIGVDDHDITLFESQYPVPQGVSYNSYFIDDEKLAVIDSVDASKAALWLDNVGKALHGRTSHGKHGCLVRPPAQRFAPLGRQTGKGAVEHGTR